MLKSHFQNAKIVSIAINGEVIPGKCELVIESTPTHEAKPVSAPDISVEIELKPHVEEVKEIDAWRGIGVNLN